MDSVGWRWQFFLLFIYDYSCCCCCFSSLDKWFNWSHDSTGRNHIRNILDGRQCVWRFFFWSVAMTARRELTRHTQVKRFWVVRRQKVGGCRAWLCLCVFLLRCVCVCLSERWEVCENAKKRGNDKREAAKSSSNSSGAILMRVNFHCQLEATVGLSCYLLGPMATESSSQRQLLRDIFTDGPQHQSQSHLPPWFPLFERERTEQNKKKNCLRYSQLSHTATLLLIMGSISIIFSRGIFLVDRRRSSQTHTDNPETSRKWTTRVSKQNLLLKNDLNEPNNTWFVIRSDTSSILVSNFFKVVSYCKRLTGFSHPHRRLPTKGKEVVEDAETEQKRVGIATDNRCCRVVRKEVDTYFSF